jgi:UDP-GlcNAc:undecaprenyl-phosphate GlcNAc-1-phosphate transferase
MNYWSVFFSGFLGLGVVCMVIPLTLKFWHRLELTKREQDLHHTPGGHIPRLGGLALAVAFVAIEVFCWIFYPQSVGHSTGRFAILVASLLMFGLGFWDDLRPLGARRKLLAQILIALAVWCFGVGIQKFKLPFTETVIDLHGWGLAVTLLWLVGMTNLINLIDGVDGLAGGICLMLMMLLGYVGHQGTGFELLTAGMAGALLGFLWFNFPPARIYMGDGGAYFLGFQIGAFSLAGSQKGTIIAALAAPLFVLALPIVDVSLAILRRGLRGLPIFRPDRRHLHHHLLDTGLSRRRAVLTLYGITLVFLVMGFVAFWSRGQLVPILLGVAVLVLLFCAGKFRFSREWFAVGRVLGNSLAMRQQIQYALCLIQWLEFEGKRHPSIDTLWKDLIFLVQRLGFTSIELTLEDEARVWKDPAATGVVRTSRHQLQGGLRGTLELQAPAHGGQMGTEATSQEAMPCAPIIARLESGRAPVPLDANLFEILSELVAEGWLRATKGWEQGNQFPLKFASRAPLPKQPAFYPLLQRSSPVVAPARVVHSHDIQPV